MSVGLSTGGEKVERMKGELGEEGSNACNKDLNMCRLRRYGEIKIN